MTFKSHIHKSARLAPDSLVNRSAGITLAVSAHWPGFPEKFDWIAANGFGLEYSPDPSHFERVTSHLAPYLENSLPVRHHAYFPGLEIADADGRMAERAMTVHYQAIDAIKGVGNPVVTVHIGLPAGRPLDLDRAKNNLTALVGYGRKNGIRVNIENLRSGPASNPDTIMEWAEVSGAGITMDIGHAVSSDAVRQGTFTAPEIVDLFAPRLDEIHLYESETDTHHAPEDLSILGPIFDRLVLTGCRWWTIELDDYRQILHTRHLVRQYLADSHCGRHLVANEMV